MQDAVRLLEAKVDASHQQQEETNTIARNCQKMLGGDLKDAVDALQRDNVVVAGKANQMAQDGNALRMGRGSSSTRVSAKTKSAYDNSRWDLVDAVEKGMLDVSAAPAAALPSEMQTLDGEARAAYVEELAAERAQIKAEIEEVSSERKKYIKRKRAEAPEAEESFDDAMIEALEEQL